MSTPRSWRRSSTFLSDSGYLTYIITKRRMTSGEESNQRNGFGGGFGSLRRGMPQRVGEDGYDPTSSRYRLG